MFKLIFSELAGLSVRRNRKPSFDGKTELRCNDINIRDPFVLYENGKYYLYGTRARNFGKNTGGFDVYVSEDLVSWSLPHECFNSEKYNMNYQVNWAPEVHKYQGAYYMFATFTRKYNKLRGTFVLRSESPMGPFVPHSEDCVTPKEWECLDGTLYTDEEGKPYIIFCHEHTQIIDGTMCYAPLSDDLKTLAGEPVTMFKASEPHWADVTMKGVHRITDGPFMYRAADGCLLMLWSTHIKGKYAQCVVRFKNGRLGMDFEHLEPLVDNDGGHGMIFKGKGDRLYLTYHTPNIKTYERPYFTEIEDTGDNIIIKNK